MCCWNHHDDALLNCVSKDDLNSLCQLSDRCFSCLCFRFKLAARTLVETGDVLRNMRSNDETGVLPFYYFEPSQYYYTPPYVTAQPDVSADH